MVFSSVTFTALFLPAAIILYFLNRNPSWRNAVLIVFSLLFYAWGEPVRIVVMVFSVCLNWLCGLMVSRSENRGIRRAWMLIGVGVSLGTLVYFKYFAFMAETVCVLLGVSYKGPEVTLPIGISFYTFQVLTYTIDVWRGKVEVQRSLPRLMMYVSFFPQLIAGPIVNYKDIEKSLGARVITGADFHAGMLRFLDGFAKKVLLANLCGELLEQLLPSGESMSVLSAWLSAVVFGLQIYFDFSGYSDMAIGMGRMFGFRFRENFDHPYMSSSVSEFWRRWHISLGAFFREYVYIPLGGNRVGPGKQIRNLAVVWALTGLWHGASWNFVFWGLYYGVLLILEKLILADVLRKMPAVFRHLYTLFAVLIGWILFYHESMTDVLAHIGALFGIGANGLHNAQVIYCLKRYAGILAAAVLACFPWGKLMEVRTKRGGRHLAPRASSGPSGFGLFMHSAVSTVLFAISMCFIVGQSYNPFLYFRF